uniref:BHLH domain-containing protein n=2 Tax=Acrobeloides nanus TaxID=290746 RepID=A0A914C5Q7_9BILA
MDQTVLAENAKKFIELYGLATQLMNMGGRFLGNGQSAGSSDDGGGNGVLSEVVRPQFRGVTNYQPNYDQSNSLNEYGGGPLGGGSRGVQSAQRSAIDRLLNTFLGSSFGSGGSEASSNLFSPGYGTDYGSDSSRFGSSGSGSNIDALIGALSASVAQQRRCLESVEFKKLSAVLPISRAISEQHLDKNTIVRLASTYIRLHKCIRPISSGFHKYDVPFTQLVELLDGFLICLSETYDVLYVIRAALHNQGEAIRTTVRMKSTLTKRSSKETLKVYAGFKVKNMLCRQ